jgi:hypothetical protein
VAIGQARTAIMVLALLAGCRTAVAGEFTVEIGGAEGATFGGTCLLITADKNANHAASGTVPLTFEFAGDLISCAIQKKSGPGQLRIVIKNISGQIVAQSSDVQPFGVVIAAGR